MSASFLSQHRGSAVPMSERKREERQIIASFTSSQPTIHAFRHRQAVPRGISVVIKIGGQGAQFSFSLSLSLSLVKPCFCLSALFPFFLSHLSFVPLCLPIFFNLFIAYLLHFSLFPFLLSFPPPPNFLSFMHFASLSITLLPSLPYYKLHARNRAVSLGVEAAAEYQIEGKTLRQKEREREREQHMMSQLRRDLPTEQGYHHTCHPHFHHPMVNGLLTHLSESCLNDS